MVEAILNEASWRDVVRCEVCWAFVEWALACTETVVEDGRRRGVSCRGERARAGGKWEVLAGEQMGWVGAAWADRGRVWMNECEEKGEG